LNKYPNSALAKKAFEQHRSDPDSETFVDGDPERFRYCLDYLRRGKATLPRRISKAFILDDLKEYGIEGVDPDTILLDDPSVFDAASKIRQLELDHKATMQRLQREHDVALKRLTQEREYETAAYACFKYFLDGGTLVNITTTTTGLNFSHPLEANMLNRALVKYGLQYKSSTEYGKGMYSLTLEEIPTKKRKHV